jgi:FMN-dependent NADH-azoreductase
LKAILATIGLQDLIFFSVQGTGAGSHAAAETRIGTHRALEEHFSSLYAHS